MSTDERETRCRSCGTEIVWRSHKVTGKLAPIEAAPSESGNCELLPDGVSYLTFGHADAKARRDAGVQLFRNHFSSCAQGRSWRKGTGKVKGKAEQGEARR